MAPYAEDIELVAAMLAGEESAFATFGDRYVPALYRFALARVEGDSERAREAVQAALVKALSGLRGYRGEAALLTWLCACCRNEILMQIRSRRTAPVHVELVAETLPGAGTVSPPPADPEALLLRRETALQVHVALDLLPPRYALALEWKYVDRLAVEEIAGRLGVTAKAAESLLARARQAFRSTYERAREAARPAPEEDLHHGRAHARA